MPRKPGSVWEELPAGAALSEGEAAVLAHLFSVQQRAPLWAPGPPPPDGHFIQTAVTCRHQVAPSFAIRQKCLTWAEQGCCRE